MYLIVSSMPMYTDGHGCFIKNSWFHDFPLARDWWAAPFGPILLLAPVRPMGDHPEQLVRIDDFPGVEVVPAYNALCRIDQFWLRERNHFLGLIHRYLPMANVVHSSVDSLFRPWCQTALRAAYRSGVPTVLVGPDMDLHEIWRERIHSGSLAERLRRRIHLKILDWNLHYHMARADLTLLKEGAVYERHCRFGANAKAYCHTMHSERDVISETVLEERVASLCTGGAPLRLVYCGRLVPYKGVHVSLEVVRRAIRKGARVTFDIIGGGPEEQALRKSVSDSGLESSVHFHGPRSYGPDLIRALSGYDILIHSPVEEDTPRMVFDGYAAGLPLLGTSIPFIVDRAKSDNAAFVFPVNDAEAGSEMLLRLDRDRGDLEQPMRRARLAGLRHAVECWCRKRRDWMIDAMERRRLAVDGGADARTKKSAFGNRSDSESDEACSGGQDSGT